MNVVLAMFKSDGSRRDFPVKKGRVILGRARGCDLRIPLSSVSRQHCEIRLEDDRLLLRDLGSSNGTFCNHSRVQETALKAGDEITVGPVAFRVIIDGKPAELAQSAPSHDLDSEATSAGVMMEDESAVPAPAAEPVTESDALPVVEDAIAVSADEEAPVLPDDSIAEPAEASSSAAPAEDEAVTVDEVVEVIDEVVEAAPTPRAESPVKPATPPPAPAEPEELPVVEEPVAQEPEVQEEELPEFLEEAEPSSPTVDMDDPIAALEAMAASEAVEAEGFPLVEEEEPKPVVSPKPQPKPLPKKK